MPIGVCRGLLDALLPNPPTSPTGRSLLSLNLDLFSRLLDLLSRLLNLLRRLLGLLRLNLMLNLHSRSNLDFLNVNYVFDSWFGGSISIFGGLSDLSALCAFGAFDLGLAILSLGIFEIFMVVWLPNYTAARLEKEPEKGPLGMEFRRDSLTFSIKRLLSINPLKSKPPDLKP